MTKQPSDSPVVRPDYAIIAEWIRPRSRVLDLGCGDGALLRYLAEQRQTTGYGLELDDKYLPQCIRNGINVIQTDLDQGLAEFDDDSFDYVLLSLTLQAMHFPARLLDEMLRVGTRGIVTFPNFGHWRARIQLGLFGTMPISRTLPHQWYDTPNIHLCTLRDFEALCRDRNIDILDRRAVDHSHRSSLGLRLWPNLLGEIALYQFTRKAVSRP
jgi:methionine biosynthesis protein MetW